MGSLLLPLSLPRRPPFLIGSPQPAPPLGARPGLSLGHMLGSYMQYNDAHAPQAHSLTQLCLVPAPGTCAPYSAPYLFPKLGLLDGYACLFYQGGVSSSPSLRQRAPSDSLKGLPA